MEATTVPFPPSYSNHSSASPFLSLLRLRCRSGNQRQSPLTSILSNDSRDDERTAAAGVGVWLRSDCCQAILLIIQFSRTDSTPSAAAAAGGGRHRRRKAVAEVQIKPDDRCRTTLSLRQGRQNLLLSTDRTLNLPLSLVRPWSGVWRELPCRLASFFYPTTRLISQIRLVVGHYETRLYSRECVVRTADS